MSKLLKYIKRYQMGGPTDQPWNPYYKTFDENAIPTGRAALPPPTEEVAPPTVAAPAATSTPSNGGNLWGKLETGVNDVLPYASNIVNMFRRLPEPARPELQDAISPELVSFDADRAELDKQLRGMNAGISQASANPSLSNSQRVANLGKFLEARGKLSQSERVANAEIRNRVNMFNSEISGRNKDRIKDYNDMVVNKAVNEQRLRSENLADLGNKLQLARRDRQLMDLENRKLDIIPRVYKDTGVVDRNLQDLLEKEQHPKQKLGGPLAKYLKRI